MNSLHSRPNETAVNRTKILGLDPGHTTGVAFFEVFTSIDVGRDPRPVHPQQAEVRRVQTLTVRSHVALWETLNQIQPNVIASEGFRLYPNRAVQKTLDSFLEVEYIGVIRLYAALHARSVRHVEKMASNAKAAITDEVLKRLNYWAPTPHERDASRHALLYLLDMRLLRMPRTVVDLTPTANLTTGKGASQ